MSMDIVTVTALVACPACTSGRDCRDSLCEDGVTEVEWPADEIRDLVQAYPGEVEITRCGPGVAVRIGGGR